MWFQGQNKNFYNAYKHLVDLNGDEFILKLILLPCSFKHYKHKATFPITTQRLKKFRVAGTPKYEVTVAEADRHSLCWPSPYHWNETSTKKCESKKRRL